MNQETMSSESDTAVTPSHPAEAHAAGGPRVVSRHATITCDLYSYRRYKTWMNNARTLWKEK